MKALNRKKLITTLLVGVPLLIASSLAQAHSSGYRGNHGGYYSGPRYATPHYYHDRYYRHHKKHHRKHYKKHRKHNRRRHREHYYYDDYYGNYDGHNDRKRRGRDRRHRGGH